MIYDTILGAMPFGPIQFVLGILAMVVFITTFFYLPIFVIGVVGYFIHYLCTKYKWTNDTIYMAMLAVCVVAWFYGISRGI